MLRVDRAGEFSGDTDDMCLDFPGFVGWRSLESMHSLAPSALDGGGTGINASGPPRRFLLPVRARRGGRPCPGESVTVSITSATSAGLISVTLPDAPVPLDRGLESLRMSALTDVDGIARFGLSTFTPRGEALITITPQSDDGQAATFTLQVS